jgi:hypothetical protein
VLVQAELADDHREAGPIFGGQRLVVDYVAPCSAEKGLEDLLQVARLEDRRFVNGRKSNGGAWE